MAYNPVIPARYAKDFPASYLYADKEILALKINRMIELSRAARNILPIKTLVTPKKTSESKTTNTMLLVKMVNVSNLWK